MPAKANLNGWKEGFCSDDNEIPQRIFEYRLPQNDSETRESLTLYEKGGLLHVKKYPSAESIVNGASFCDADRILFEKMKINLPSLDDLSKYGIHICS